MGDFFVARKNGGKEEIVERNKLNTQDGKGFRKLTRALSSISMSLSVAPLFELRALAAEDIWSKASSIMQDVYGNIVAISTAAGVVTAATALLLMNFSKNGRTVDESRAWLKRIIISWVILNSLGFIMAYVAPLFSGGKWTA